MNCFKILNTYSITAGCFWVFAYFSPNFHTILMKKICLKFSTLQDKYTSDFPVQPLTSFRIYLSHKNVNMETCGDENTKEKKGEKEAKDISCSFSFFSTTNRFMNPKNVRVEFK